VHEIARPEQMQISYRQVDREALEQLISVGILKSLEDLVDCFDIRILRGEGLDVEVQSRALAQAWIKVFVGGFDEIKPVLPGLPMMIVDLAAVGVAEDAFERLWVISFELDLGLLALLGAC
jgi:hypothetical protein